MRVQWAVPVIASILILGTLGLSQDVYALTTTLDTLNTGMACESLGGVWNPTTKTCTVVTTALTIPAGDTLIVQNGVTLRVEALTFIADLDNDGIISNEGTIIVESGTVTLIRNDGTFTNNGKVILDVIGAGGDAVVEIRQGSTSTFTNNGQMLLDIHKTGVRNTIVEIRTFTAASTFINNGELSLDNHGVFSIAGGGAVVELESKGPFTNNGLINIDNHATGIPSFATSVIDNFAGFDNHGTINLNNHATTTINALVTLANAGLFLNHCTGVINIDNQAVTPNPIIELFNNDNLGTFNNSGFISPVPTRGTITDTSSECLPPIVEVNIDIKPESDPNSVNCKANKKGEINGVVPIGIFSSNSFDATTIDLNTLTLNGNPTLEVHGKLHIEDSNAVIHVSTADICAATSVDKSLEDVVIGGENADGPFEGTDAVRILKR